MSLLLYNMDEEDIRNLDDVRPSIYRTALKIQRLQRNCHMDVVLVRHIAAALPMDRGVQLMKEEVTCALDRMFQNVSPDGDGQVTSSKAEDLCAMVCKMIDRSTSGAVAVLHLQVVLICLSAESLQLKYRALVRAAETSSGHVSRSTLRTVLDVVSLVPGLVQEARVFGAVDDAVAACFDGVQASTTSCEQMLSWLQSEPRLLLWLPTLYRLSIAKNVTHNVRCHTCKTAPITGLRYRCMKCVNVQVCQGCFLTDRQSSRHKTHHPVIEFCNQPTWKESLSSLVKTSRRALLPRRYTQRAADRRWSLLRNEPERAEASREESDSPVSQVPPSPEEKSIVQKNSDTEDLRIETTLMAEVRNIHRDKWLLEQELQAWRLTVQSEHGLLEDRCAQMEFTMETLVEKNLNLQESLAQALTKLEMKEKREEDLVRSHCSEDQETEVTTERVKEREMMYGQVEEESVMDVDREGSTQSLVTTDDEEAQEGEEEGMMVREDLVSLVESEELKGSNEVMRGEEELSDETSQFATWHYELQEATQEKYATLSEEHEEHEKHEEEEHEGHEEHEKHEKHEEQEKNEEGRCEELLLETLFQLKTEIETYTCAGEEEGVELVRAAEQVSNSLHHLVAVMRTDTQSW